MALFETHYYSYTLGSNITLNVIIPTPKSGEDYHMMGTEAPYLYKEGIPVLYLLHGANGDAFSWMRYSSIERYAQDHGLAVVMCSAENSFYLDLPYGLKYKTFFTEELPHFICSLFPVTKEREKTYVAGLSMGGFGAWYLALSRPELYSKAASLSGALDIVLLGESRKAEGHSNDRWNHVFGDYEEGTTPPYDLFLLTDQAKAQGLPLPKLFQACGTEDFLYENNQSARRKMEERGMDLLYEEGPGAHTWEFWDTWIRRVLDWIDEA